MKFEVHHSKPEVSLYFLKFMVFLVATLAAFEHSENMTSRGIPRYRGNDRDKVCFDIPGNLCPSVIHVLRTCLGLQS